MSLTLNIPTINDDLKDFDKLFELWEQLNEDCSEVIIDFSQCFFLRQNAVAFLGGLIRIIKSRSIKLNINRDSIRRHIKMNLEQNGFMYVFCENKEPRTAKPHFSEGNSEI